jgi:hypothetical protein
MGILKMAAMYRRVVIIDSQSDVYLMVWRDGDPQNDGHEQMSSKNRFSSDVHDGLQGMVIYKWRPCTDEK